MKSLLKGIGVVLTVVMGLFMAGCSNEDTGYRYECYNLEEADVTSIVTTYMNGQTDSSAVSDENIKLALAACREKRGKVVYSQSNVSESSLKSFITARSVDKDAVNTMFTKGKGIVFFNTTDDGRCYLYFEKE